MTPRAILSLMDPLRPAPDEPRSGVVTVCTWEFLERVLHDSGFIRPHERVTAFVIHEAGVHIYLETVR